MNLGAFSFPWQKRAANTDTPESSPGGPVYDARIDPAISAGAIVASERLAAQRDLHLWGDKSAPAQAFSHYFESQPAPLLGNLARLSFQRDQIERVVSRKDLPPFPGVELGHVPAFAAAPSTNPITQPVQHLTHHAHQVESKRATRLRFGH